MAIASQWGQKLQAWWQGATPATRAMATGLVLLMAVGFAVAASLAASPDYQPIYHGVSGKDAAAIENTLREHAIPMHFNDKEGTVSVPAKDESSATMYIEAAGVLSKDATPDGLDPATNISPMDGPDVIQQKTNAAKEYAMDRKLARIEGIQSAAVAYAPGKDAALFGNDTAPSASVVLTLKPGERLNSQQVKGIVNLVAGAVTGLTTANVKLTDQSGILLWKDPSAGGLGGDDDPTRQNAEFSTNETTRVQSLLDETFGPHKVIVTVTAELNFDQIHKDEVEHPVVAGGAAGTLVSVRTNEEKYSGSGPAPVGGVAGAGSNLNVSSYTTGGKDGGGGKYSKTDTVENHDPNVSHVVTQVAPGTVKRESAAALVDTSVSADNLPKIKETIATAILAQTGDSSRFVTVQPITFDTSAQKAAATQMQSLASQALMTTIARTLAVAVVACVLLFLLTRTGRRAKPETALTGGANIGLLDPLPDAEMASILGGGGMGQSAGGARSIEELLEERPLTVEDVLAEMPEAESRPRRRPRAPSIEEQQDVKMESIRSMVDAHPESVSLLLKGWMADDVKVG